MCSLRHNIFLSIAYIFFFSFVFTSIAPIASAATLYLDPTDPELHRGDTVTLSVRVSTDPGECINVADVVVGYDSAVRAVDVSRGNSIFSLWVEDPVIDEENHRISFAGGIPGGYCGRIPGDPVLTNTIAEIVFRLPGFNVGGTSKDTASVWIEDISQVLLHDQFGTKAPLTLQNATIRLINTAGSQVEDDWSARVAEDDAPPSEFIVTLTRDDSAFSGSYFITFNTQDKQSGIDHYEVMEEPFEDFNLFRWGRADAPWVVAQSPYVLKDQSLNSTIRVKAIDKAGNETIEILVPDEALRSLSLGALMTYALIVMVVVLLVMLLGYVLWRRKQQVISEYEDHA